MKVKRAVRLSFGSLQDWLKDALCLQRMPADLAERRRMKCFTLSSGAGSAMRSDADGKIHIEIEKCGENR